MAAKSPSHASSTEPAARRRTASTSHQGLAVAVDGAHGLRPQRLVEARPASPVPRTATWKRPQSAGSSSTTAGGCSPYVDDDLHGTPLASSVTATPALVLTMAWPRPRWGGGSGP